MVPWHAWVVNRKVQVHAVVRHDEYIADIRDAVTVVAVLPSKDEAMREVDRLNALREGRGSTYFWTPAKYYPGGRQASGTE